jgi:hypothetical protein
MRAYTTWGALLPAESHVEIQRVPVVSAGHTGAWLKRTTRRLRGEARRSFDGRSYEEAGILRQDKSPAIPQNSAGTAGRLARTLAAAATVLALSPASGADAYDATIRWAPVHGANSYNIYLRHFSSPIVGEPDTRNLPPEEVVIKISLARQSNESSSDISYTVRNIPLGPTVFFTVKAVDDTGESRSSNEQYLTYESVAHVLDSDHDGLTDAEEDLNLDGFLDADETDSQSADTDGDGINDGDEIFETGTDPRNRDSDADGIDDAVDGCNDVDQDGFGSRAAGASCPKDNCLLAPNPLQRDSDQDGMGELCDPCTNVNGSQNYYQKHVLKFGKVNSEPRYGNDSFKTKGDFRLPSSAAYSELNPIEEGARMIVSGADGTVFIDVELAPGALTKDRRARGWKLDRSRKSWKYLDRAIQPPQGIHKLIVKDMSRRWAQTARVIVKGKKADYPVLDGDQPISAVVVLGDQLTAESGGCVETPYEQPDCRFRTSGRALICD